MTSEWVDFPGGEFHGGLTPDEAKELAKISASVTERFLEDDPDKWSWGAQRQAFAERTGNLDFLVPLLVGLCPPRRVDLKPFRLARQPVTNEQFAEFCRLNAIEWKEALHSTPDEAATGVPFELAVRFAQWSGARLPTVDEWERAARGTSRRLFPWGPTWAAAADATMDNPFNRGWAPGRHAGLASPEGCLDLIGASGEWCAGSAAPDLEAWSRWTQKPKHTLGRHWPVVRGRGGPVIPNAALALGMAPDEGGFLPGFRLACDVRSLDELFKDLAAEKQDPAPLARHLASFGKAALTPVLRAPDEDAVRQVLEIMGPVAAPEAIEPLVACARRIPKAVLALWSVSPDSVIQSGLQRAAGPRQILVEHLAERQHADLARILDRLLDDPDSDVARFAIEGDGKKSPWLPVVYHLPEKVPLAKLRRLGALKLLAQMRRPEDVPRMLGAIRGGKFTPDDHDVWWLASHPDSEALVPVILKQPKPDALLQELARRRLAAGLELTSRELMECDYDDESTTLAAADEAFLAGNLEDWHPVSAFRRYAQVLSDDPRCASAAFLLAWMDRAFGSVVTNERVAWIRAKGFRDEKLLATLASPPAWTLPGSRVSAHPAWTREWIPCVERIAPLLPSLAALTCRGGGRDAQLDRDAKAQLALMRA